MIDIIELLEQGEGITVEFKQSKRELNKDTFESVCAMLNRLGGHLFLGVEDDGTVCGIDRDCIEKIKKNFVTQMNNPDKINPPFYTQLQEYDIDGKVILYAQIPATPDVHRTAGKIFDRNEDGDFNITNNTSLVAQLYNRKSNISYTETKIFPMVSVDDLDKDTINKVRIMAKNQRGGEHPWETMSDLELLKSANLYGRDLCTGKEGINLAGILLLGTQQLIFSALPYYKTDAIVRRENLDRYDDRIVVLDNLVVANTKLMEFIEKHLNDKFYLEGTQRINIRNKIFREVCANLLIHREFYSAYPAKLIIESDKVRTENANKPNGFGIIDAKSFSPYPKNPAIAKFFREIGLADELGSGVKNVTKYLKIYSGGEPEFIEEDIFKQILPIKEQKTPDTTTEEQKHHRNTTENTTEKGKDIFDEIICFCSVPKTRAEIQEHIGLKDKNNFIKNYLKPLLNQGRLIMTIPDNPNNRNQRYVAK